MPHGEVKRMRLGSRVKGNRLMDRQPGFPAHSEEHQDRWHILSEGLDRVLLPVALGCLSMLVVVQALTAVPAVRRFVDARSNGYVQVDPRPASAAASQQAVLHLYLAPAKPRPDLQVLVNGQVQTTFQTVNLSVVVHAGDVVQFRAGEPGVAFVQVDHDAANLLWPAPGQTVEIDQPDVVVSLPAAEFVP
ncbi:hypothetical protein [Alicyclobacillus macrosporangiidus]|uniref:hypothetical protein n=1 Tax=Alicyclobacillus macrosporangiidus TaxID=392015 RepID=UPI00055070D3|nr:hypothetical protein [Alicyclobacillus macrosporangiidus]